MPRDPRSLKICLFAGEASGDALGARLMAAIKDESKDNVSFFGVGGPLMEAQGMQSLFPMRDLSVMGIAEVLPRLPKILKRITQAAALVKDMQPDMVVTIDSPDFSFRVARKIRELMPQPPRMVHYVAPTVWAWRPERAKKVAALYDGIMCLYPFEPPYFEAEGMNAMFVGHSVLESGYADADAQAFRKAHEIPQDAEVLGLLFGSRMGELNRVGPLLHDVAVKLAKQNPDLHIVSPTFAHLAPQVQNLLEGVKCKTHVISDQHGKWDCFAAMDKALATSGTVGLELAVAGVPHVIAYKMNALTWQIVRRKVTVKYAHLANILLDEPVVPEFIQGDCNVVPVTEALLGVDSDSQQTSFEDVRQMLGSAHDDVPSVQAAKFLLDPAYLRLAIGT